MKAIKEFQGEYRFLSNFYRSPITIGHLEYDTVEHLYQCAKTMNAYDFNRVFDANTPALAKKLGKQVDKRKDWEEVKVGIMLNAVLLKFLQNKDLRKKLIETDNAVLIEGNTWGDHFWGVCNGEGKNWLGRILMIVRSIMMNPHLDNLEIVRRKK